MWRFLILLCTAFLAESQKMEYLQMLFGEQLSIKLPTTESLEFTSVDESEKYTVWAFNLFGKRGSIKGSKSNRRFVIRHVCFEDQGTYIRRNIFKTIDYIAKVKVFPKRTSWVCVRGDSCSISLNGVEKEKASLRFSNENVSLMLVVRGSPVTNLPDYADRIKVTSSSIQLLNFNVSDEGNYTLYEGQDRKAVTTRLYFSEPHDGIDASPLLSLLLLLGIPVGICCCCRKRLRKKNQATAMTTIQSHSTLSPSGPPPDYSNHVDPAGPVPTYAPGYPAPGESQDHPPPDPPYAVPVQPQYGGEPAMPPQGPASGYPPAQPSYWTGPQYNPAAPAMYTPGYPAPADSQIHPPPPHNPYPPLPQYGGQPALPPNPGFTPVMYNVPAGSETGGNKEGLKMSELSPAASLLGPTQTEVGLPPAPYTGTDVLNSNSSAVQFNRTNHNFL
uniref:Uncharacterized protein n=1 Tax=Astyanax mexicanus TaxID=7994 RepID=A0A8B9KJ42_ASTMX